MTFHKGALSCTSDASRTVHLGSVQGVIDLLGSIHIIESDAPSHTRLEQRLVERLASLAGEFDEVALTLVHGGRSATRHGAGIASVVSGSPGQRAPAN